MFRRQHLLKKNRRSYRKRIAAEAQFSYEISHGLTRFGAYVIAAVYLLSYLFENMYANTHFDTLWLRVTMACLFVAFGLRVYWPIAIAKYLPQLWVVFIALVLPYCYGSIVSFNAAMSPENEAINLLLLTEYILASFFFVQLIFHVNLILLVWCTTNILVFGQLLFVENVNYALVGLNAIYIVAFFVTALVVGGITNRRLFNFQLEREKAVWNVANAIAHQLRTPLATIRNLSHGTRTHVPMLVEKYRLAMEIDSTLKPLSNRKLELLNDALVNIEEEVEYSNALIDILIANSRPFDYAAAPGQSIWITTAIETAVNTYPYNNPRERSLVNYNPANSFKVDASERMICHVMYNLIGNAVEFSQKKPDGKIRIWLEQGEQWNKVIVWDSGIGVPRHFQHQVFDMFFSRNSPNGTGIGLSFCKAVMEGIGGKIECQTQANEYCQFTLSFPHPAV
jgi:two-component system CAI-1 autoinducer sensor kinase/phosphatase CqsS